MKYIIAYVPYSRGDREQIEMVFCDTDEELIRVISETVGCCPVEYDEDAHEFYDPDTGDTATCTLGQCMVYLEENFVGDGSFGATMLTVTQGTNVLFQG